MKWRQDKEFKTLIIRMVNEIKERIDELSQNFNEEVENTKEIEIIKKNDSEKKNSRNKKKH